MQIGMFRKVRNFIITNRDVDKSSLYSFQLIDVGLPEILPDKGFICSHGL